MFYYNLTRITNILHEDRYKFFNVRRSVLLRMRNVSDKCCNRNQNTLFVSSNSFYTENCTVYEIMWKNVVQPAGHR
jgi:hypothetical protein